jgi:type I phosphodiesterase/nucleotide pyrophosphatase/tetratricopeptide repeat protein
MIRKTLVSVVLAAIVALLVILSVRMHAARTIQLAGQPGGRPVIFVGLDGADWDLLDDYLVEGVMPNLATLVREGRAGVLTTLHPPLSPLVWTSMMTGVDPLDHGILDFTRFHPKSRMREPITSDERRVPAVWNMVSDAGRKVAIFGLWATYPAERVEGLMVSDRLFSYQYAETNPPPGVVYPPDREMWARGALQKADAEIDVAAMRQYLPWLGEVEYPSLVARNDPFAHPVSALRRILIETRVYHELATAWMSEGRPDLSVVYFQGTDAIGHLFAPYAPPRQEGIPLLEFERYSQVPRLYFAYVDRLLGEYRDLAKARGAVLMIASDHGFRWKEGRPKEFSGLLAATAGRWHRDEGIYVLWGPGIAPGPAPAPGAGHLSDSTARSPAGNVQQVCATLLALLGLPPAEGIAGPPLGGVVSSGAAAVDYRATYHPAEPAASGAPDNPPADPEALAKLRALGYIGASETTSAPSSEGAPRTASDPGATRTPGSYNNEGLILREHGEAGPAIAAFEQAIAMDPHLASALWNLSDLLFAAGRDAGRSDDLLIRSLRDGSPDGVRNVVSRAIARRRTGGIERSLEILAAAVALRPQESELWLFRGRYRVETGDCRGALEDFRRAERIDPANALVPASSGLARLCLGDTEGARREFRRSLEIDPDQPELRRSLEQGP